MTQFVQNSVNGAGRHRIACGDFASCFLRSQFIDGINVFPCKIDIVSSKVSINSRFPKDWTPKIEVIDHSLRRKWKYLSYQRRQFRVGTLACAISVDQHRHGIIPRGASSTAPIFVGEGLPHKHDRILLCPQQAAASAATIDQAFSDALRGWCFLRSAILRAGIVTLTKPQCDIRTGTVIAFRIARVAPPSTNSRRREWP